MDPRGEGAAAAPRPGECASEEVLPLFFSSVEAAISAATEEGDVVALVAAEGLVHSGRAVLSRPGVTLTTLGFEEIGEEDLTGGASSSAAPGPRRKKSERAATLSHETSRPYESTVSISAPRCRVIGLTIRHSSPSVANNYALHVEEAAAASEDDERSPITIISECDVASASGTALGTEAPTRVSHSRFASNSRFGAAVFAPGPPRTTLLRCELSGGGKKWVKGDVKNGGGSGGLLVRGGDVEVKECVLSGDPFAMRLVDGTGVVSGCEVVKGRVEEGWEGVVMV